MADTSVGETRDDSRMVIELLQREHPGVTVWRGRFTGSWWALIGDRGTSHIEAESAERLRELLRVALGPPRPGGDGHSAPTSVRRTGPHGGMFLAVRPGPVRRLLSTWRRFFQLPEVEVA